MEAASIRFRDGFVSYARSRNGDLLLLNDHYCVFMALNYAVMHADTIAIRVALRRESAIRFDDSLVIGEDTDLWTRLAEVSQVAYLDVPLAVYGKHGAGITSSKQEYSRDTLTVHKRNLKRLRTRLTPEELDRYKGKVSNIYADLGCFYFENEKNAKAIITYIRCFFVKNRKKSTA